MSRAGIELGEWGCLLGSALVSSSFNSGVVDDKLNPENGPHINIQSPKNTPPSMRRSVRFQYPNSNSQNSEPFKSSRLLWKTKHTF